MNDGDFKSSVPFFVGDRHCDNSLVRYVGFVQV
jgi:hypothetical protein